MCAREPRLFGRLRAALAALAGAWHVWQGGARGPRGGGAPARAHLARTTCPRRHSDSANSWVNFQHLPCFHGLVLTYYYNYYVQEVAQHSATPPFVLAAKWKTCSMLNVVWPYMGSGQWTAKVKPRLVACYYVVVHQAKLMSLVEELGSPGRFAVRNRSLALRAIGSATACTTGSDSATRLPVCVRRLFVRLMRLFDRLK